MSSGKFHGMIWAATPSGFATRPGERVLELVRPARVVPEVRRGERHVDVAALLDRLARVHRLEDGELAAALLEDARDPEQVLGAFLAGQAAPRPALGAARGADRLVDVGRRRARDLGERLFGRRVDRGERGAIRGRDLAPTDEQPVALLERDDVTRLGRRRVLPRDRLTVAEAPAVRGALAGGCDARVGVGGHRMHYGTRHGSAPFGAPARQSACCCSRRCSVAVRSSRPTEPDRRRSSRARGNAAPTRRPR